MKISEIKDYIVPKLSKCPLCDSDIDADVYTDECQYVVVDILCKECPCRYRDTFMGGDHESIVKSIVDGWNKRKVVASLDDALQKTADVVFLDYEYIYNNALMYEKTGDQAFLSATKNRALNRLNEMVR